MDDEGEKDEVADVEGDEYLAIFLGHTLTPPLVEATIMVMKQTKLYIICLFCICINSYCLCLSEYLARQVLSDMTLILLSVVGNLFVLNSLREKEALLAITQNLVRPIFCSFMLTMKRG